MKRIVALLVVLGVSGLVIGCGGKPTPAPPAPKADMGKAASTTTPPAEKPAEAKPADKGDGEEMEGPGEGTEKAPPEDTEKPAAPSEKPEETETEEKPQ